MKKQTIVKVLLILLPVLAVGLATTSDSVTVLDTAAQTVTRYSYFDMVPVKNLQMLLPLAAILSLLSGILAAVWLGKKKTGCLKAAGYCAFASAMAACVPILLRGEVIVIPNVALPLFMLAQFGVSRFAAKLPQKQPEKKGQRLKAHI